MQPKKVAFIIFLSLISVIAVIEAKDVKVFKRGKVTLIDETQFKNPHDYEFNDDQDETDLDNAYDEKVPYLPKYILHKNGIDQGYTRVPIVTRKGENTWSTPRPTTQRGEEYKTWGTPKILPITKPTPSHPDISRTTPVPRTTFIAKFSVPPTKTEKQPAKKPEVKTPSTTSEEIPITKLKKFFTRRPTTSTESTTEAPTESVSTKKKQLFTRRPSTTSSSTEKSKEVTKSRERTTSKSVETITEEFTTDFTRKSFKKPKTTATTASASEETVAASTKKKQQFTRRPSTTSASSEETISSTSRKQFTRRPTSKSTEAASTETSTETTKITRRKFTRKPTSTESTTESSTTEASTRRKFTRRPKPSSTESASTESSTEVSTRKKFTRKPTTTTTSSSEEHSFKTKGFFTKRPTTSSSSVSTESEATTTKRKFTRKPKPTTTTEEVTTMLPLKDRLRPILTTREPTPTMPRRFRVFTNPAPAEPPTEELNPQQEIENQRKLKEKLSFNAEFNQEFSSKHAKNQQNSAVAAAAAAASSSFRRTLVLSQKRDVPIGLNSKDSKLEMFHFSKFAQRFGIQRIIPSSFATTPQASIIVTPVTASPIVVANTNNIGNGVEQTVRSNAIILQAQKNPFFLPSNVTSNPSLFSSSSSSTPAPQVLHRWSSSWSSWSSWDANGQKVTGSTKTFSTSETSEATTTPTPSQSNSKQLSRTRTEQSSTISSSKHSNRAPIKPHIIHHGRHRYRGPTYNCRVLTPNEDGRPSSNNDPTCKLKFPGFPADDSCRCRYDVEARDDRGCATGFLYTCKRISQQT